MQVIGARALWRGGDNPVGIRPTHSPTAFITDLGAAYRESDRTAPDHGQLRDPSLPGQLERSASFAHPNNTTIAIADYRKLVALLGKAFDGTAQPGSTLPIVYGEFGVESIIPSQKASPLHGYRSRPPSSRSTSALRVASTETRSPWRSVSRT